MSDNNIREILYKHFKMLENREMGINLNSYIETAETQINQEINKVVVAELDKVAYIAEKKGYEKCLADIKRKEEMQKMYPIELTSKGEK